MRIFSKHEKKGKTVEIGLVLSSYALRDGMPATTKRLRRRVAGFEEEF